VRERAPGARVIAPASVMLPTQPGAVVAATAAALSKSRDAVARLVALHVRATKFVHEDPERATRDVVDFIGKGLVEPAVMRKALTSDTTHLIADPRAIVDSTRLLQDFQKRIGTLPVEVDIDALFDFSFYDAALRAG
jgi:NitT/TauT family transport system substrate-binding protein